MRKDLTNLSEAEIEEMDRELTTPTTKVVGFLGQAQSNLSL